MVKYLAMHVIQHIVWPLFGILQVSENKEAARRRHTNNIFRCFPLKRSRFLNPLECHEGNHKKLSAQFIVDYTDKYIA